MIDGAVWRRFGAAALVSGVAHAAIAVFGSLELPHAPADRLPLAVRIAEVAPAAAARPQARVAPRSAGHPGVRVAAAVPGASPIPAERPGADETLVDEPQPEQTAEAPEPEPQAVAVAEPPAPAPEVAPEPVRVRSLPRKGQITYDLVYGRDRFPVGRTVQTWEVDRGRYRLASRSQTTGLVDMIRSQQRTYSSTGALTREGLRPESFKADRSRGRGLEEATAQFDWDRATVTLGRPADQRQLTLPPKSQDLLSFIFQLALDPPAPGRVTQVVTNGTRLEVYELDVRREESIETPLGWMRALPIKQVRKGNEESIELWLALEYRYLPVKLRFLDRQGEPQGEQVVADIRLIEN